MTDGPDLEINADLFAALLEVLGRKPAEPEPVVILAQYLYSLAGGYGLSDSSDLTGSHLERLAPPTATSPLIDHYLGLGVDGTDVEGLRDLLCGVFMELSGDGDARRVLNKAMPIHVVGFLIVAQVCWNLEARGARAGLPIKPAPGRDIPVQRGSQDFAKMNWSDRTNTGVIGLGDGRAGASSGASLRFKGALLAVLAARLLVSRQSGPAIVLPGLRLVVTNPERGKPRATIHLAQAPRSDIAATTAEPIRGDGREPSERSMDAEVEASVGVKSPATGVPVLVGTFAELGAVYEPRGFDVEIERMWADGGSRRIWLRGGPGLGKSYAARRVMQESLAHRSDTGDELLIWVDAADSASVTRELARAAERMPGLRVTVAPDAANRDDRLARSLLEFLRTTETRWLIVFDDARADELIRQQLLPPGTNPHGRALITTLGDSDADTAGRQVLAEQFTPGEAERYLCARLPNSSAADRGALALKADHHPLVLSMATATIAAERMTVADWLAEFDTVQLDVAADHPDTGGYPHPITATWRVALAKAGRGVAEGAVERTAMVAAIQDPAGHPSWLWRRGAVRDWVDADAEHSRRAGRIHPGVKRLVDFGILQLLGSWSDGRIAIHQMAARAVRESADPALLAELAAILAKEWILQLTENPARAQPEDVAAGTRPLGSLSGLDSFTKDAVAALLEFSEPAMSVSILRWEREELEELEPLLLRGGVIGRVDLAESHTDIGRGERARGRHAEAYARFGAAYEILEQLLEDRSLDDDQRADVLESMAELNATMDRPERAQEQKLSAVRLRERFAELAVPHADLSISNLIALTDLHHGLADKQRSAAALDRALSAQAGRQSTDSDDSASQHAELARRLASHGRVPEAIEHMRQAARLQKESKRGHKLEKYRRELGMLYAQQGEWKRAERWLRRGNANPLLLASVQLHRGNEADARTSLALAAARYAPSTSPELEDETDLDFIRMLLGLRIGLLARKAIKRKRWGDSADLAAIRLEIVRLRADSTPGEAPVELAEAYATAGMSADWAGRHDTAVEFLTSSISIFEMLSQLQPDNAAIRRGLADALAYLARVRIGAGALDDAVDMAGRAVSILEDLDPADSQEKLDFALESLALAHAEAGATDDALTLYTRRVNAIRSVENGHARDREALTELTDALGSVIWVCVNAARWSEALQPATELVELCQALADEDSDSFESQDKLARAFFALGLVHSHLDGLVESEALARKTVIVRSILLDHDPSVTARQADLAYALSVHADSLSKLERDAEAVAALTAAVNHLQLPADLDPEAHVAIQIQLLSELSSALRGRGQEAEADEVIARAHDLERRFPDLKGD